MSDPRAYPSRPYLAVSAAIFRDGKVLVVRRAKPPGEDLFTLPGGGVEIGESLTEAVTREMREELAITVEPVALAGHREMIARDADNAVARHFIVLAFAARWIAGEPAASAEIADARWCEPAELTKLPTTEGLIDIVAAAHERLQKPR